MNWAQFKYPVSHICLVGTVVASWFLTQMVVGLNPFTVTTNILSLNSVKTFRKNSNDIKHISKYIEIFYSFNKHKVRNSVLFCLNVYNFFK